MNSVLVVDDDPDIRLLLRLELEAEGYHVSTAADGEEALELIPALAPDVVLLDVMMPRVDGWTVLERLDEPKPAVIVISGVASSHEQHHRQAVVLGALGFVSKPFDNQKLLDLIATASRLDVEQRSAYRRWLLEGGSGASPS